jgi:hypothetical protein
VSNTPMALTAGAAGLMRRHGHGLGVLLLAGLALGVVPGCAQVRTPAAGTTDTDVAAILWLPEYAVLEPDSAQPVSTKNGRNIYVDGTGSVVFSMALSCDPVAKDLSGHFAQTEWRPRATQYLNPQIATSFDSGCERHGGGAIPLGSVVAPAPFVQWRGEWENRSGDIVSYSFGGIGQQMHGYAAYIPREAVEASRRRSVR